MERLNRRLNREARNLNPPQRGNDRRGAARGRAARGRDEGGPESLEPVQENQHNNNQERNNSPERHTQGGETFEASNQGRTNHSGAFSPNYAREGNRGVVPPWEDARNPVAELRSEDTINSTEAQRLNSQAHSFIPMMPPYGQPPPFPWNWNPHYQPMGYPPTMPFPQSYGYNSPSFGGAPGNNSYPHSQEGSGWRHSQNNTLSELNNARENDGHSERTTNQEVSREEDLQQQVQALKKELASLRSSMTSRASSRSDDKVAPIMIPQKEDDTMGKLESRKQEKRVEDMQASRRLEARHSNKPTLESLFEKDVYKFLQEFEPFVVSVIKGIYQLDEPMIALYLSAKARLHLQRAGVDISSFSEVMSKLRKINDQGAAERKKNLIVKAQQLVFKGPLTTENMAKFVDEADEIANSIDLEAVQEERLNFLFCKTVVSRLPSRYDVKDVEAYCARRQWWRYAEMREDLLTDVKKLVQIEPNTEEKKQNVAIHKENKPKNAYTYNRAAAQGSFNRATNPGRPLQNRSYVLEGDTQPVIEGEPGKRHHRIPAVWPPRKRKAYCFLHDLCLACFTEGHLGMDCPKIKSGEIKFKRKPPTAPQNHSRQVEDGSPSEDQEEQESQSNDGPEFLDWMNDPEELFDPGDELMEDTGNNEAAVLQDTAEEPQYADYEEELEELDGDSLNFVHMVTEESPRATIRKTDLVLNGQRSPIVLEYKWDLQGECLQEINTEGKNGVHEIVAPDFEDFPYELPSKAAHLETNNHLRSVSSLRGCSYAEFPFESDLPDPILQDEPGIDSDLPRVDSAEIQGRIRQIIHDKVESYDITLAQKQRLRSILLRNIKAFGLKGCQADFNLLPAMPVDLKDDATPFKSKPYALGPEAKEALRVKLRSLVRNKMLRRSPKPYFSSPIIMVKKSQNRGYRLVVDLRKVNSSVKPLASGLPDLDMQMSWLSGEPQYFCSLDALSGFDLMRLDEDAAQYFGISTPFGVFELLSAPQGFINTPAWYQSCVTEHLLGTIGEAALFGKTILQWLDDTLIFCKTVDEVLDVLEIFLSRCVKVNFKLSIDKCDFILTKVRWCGRIIDGTGWRFDSSYFDKVLKIPRPSTIGHLEDLIYISTWLCSSLPRFSQFSSYLSDRLREIILNCFGKRRVSKSKRKDQLLGDHWSLEDQRQFTSFLDYLRNQTERNLGLYSRTARLCLHSDASGKYWAGVLTTETDKGHRPLAFVSGKFRGSELNWSMTDKELFPIIVTLKKFRYLLLHHPSPLQVYTDHRNLLYLVAPPSECKVSTVSRLRRWLLTLQEFKLIMNFIPGTSNTFADVLSRWGSPEQQCSTPRPVPSPEERMEEIVLFKFEGLTYCVPRSQITTISKSKASKERIIEQLSNVSSTANSTTSKDNRIELLENSSTMMEATHRKEDCGLELEQSPLDLEQPPRNYASICREVEAKKSPLRRSSRRRIPRQLYTSQPHLHQLPQRKNPSSLSQKQQKNITKEKRSKGKQQEEQENEENKKEERQQQLENNPIFGPVSYDSHQAFLDSRVSFLNPKRKGKFREISLKEVKSMQQQLQCERIPGGELGKDGIWRRNGKTLFSADFSERLVAYAHVVSAHASDPVVLQLLDEFDLVTVGKTQLADMVRRQRELCLNCEPRYKMVRREFSEILHSLRPNVLFHTDYLKVRGSYILVFVEDATRKVLLIHRPAADFQGLMEAVTLWKALIGLPKNFVLHSDQGSSFANHFIRAMEREFPALHQYSITYSAWSNAPVETMNTSILRCLKRLCSQYLIQADEWMALLPLIMAHLNNRPSSSGYSANELLGAGIIHHGMIPSVKPEDDLTKKIRRIERDFTMAGNGKIFNDQNTEGTDGLMINGQLRWGKNKTLVKQYLDEIGEELNKRIAKRMQDLKDRRDISRKLANEKFKLSSIQFGVGDLVLVSSQGLTRKADKVLLLWKGPMTVCENIGNNCYRCLDINGESHVVHAQRLKYYDSVMLPMSEEVKATIYYNMGPYSLDCFEDFSDEDEVPMLLCRWVGFTETNWQPLKQIYDDQPKMVTKYAENMASAGERFVRLLNIIRSWNEKKEVKANEIHQIMQHTSVWNSDQVRIVRYPKMISAACFESGRSRNRGWTKAELMVLQEGIYVFGVGKWRNIIQYLPGKTVVQLVEKTKKLMGYQRIAEFHGLKVDLDKLRKFNDLRKGYRRHGVLINRGPQIDASKMKELQLEMRKKFGPLEIDSSEVLIHPLEISELSEKKLTITDIQKYIHVLEGMKERNAVREVSGSNQELECWSVITHSYIDNDWVDCGGILDSGATRSCVGSSHVRKSERIFKNDGVHDKLRTVRDANGRVVRSLGYVVRDVRISVKTTKAGYRSMLIRGLRFFVIDSAGFSPLIIGNDVLLQLGISPVQALWRAMEAGNDQPNGDKMNWKGTSNEAFLVQDVRSIERITLEWKDWLTEEEVKRQKRSELDSWVESRTRRQLVKFKLDEEVKAKNTWRLEVKNTCFDVWLQPPDSRVMKADITSIDWSGFGQYGMVLLDPAWKLKGAAIPNRGLTIDYNCLSDEQIFAIPIGKLVREGFVATWIVNGKMEGVLRWYRSEGFEPVETIVWTKLSQKLKLWSSMGHLLRHSHELLVLGRKGKPKEVLRQRNSDGILARVSHQSCKPEGVYTILEDLLPNCRRLEVFARLNNVRSGWDSLGLEL